MGKFYAGSIGTEPSPRTLSPLKQLQASYVGKGVALQRPGRPRLEYLGDSGAGGDVYLRIGHSTQAELTFNAEGLREYAELFLALAVQIEAGRNASDA